RALGVAVGIAELDAHEEAVELRFGQREGSHLVRRVLRGDHEEGLGQAARLAFGRHLVLLHRLEQRRLRLRRRAVDLVGEDELREHRTRMELEGRAVAVVDRHADDVGRQHVARELDAVEVEAQQLRQHMRERRLADAGEILDQQVPAREQAGEREPDLTLFAEDDLARLLNDALYRRKCHSRVDRRIPEFTGKPISWDAEQRHIGSFTVATAYITHADCMKHDMGRYHPECPARLSAIEDHLIASGVGATLQRHEAPEAKVSELARVHPLEYIEAIREASPERGIVHLDPDTAMCPDTLSAALHAAGAAV